MDKWDGKGFPEELQVRICNLPELEYTSEEEEEYEDAEYKDYDLDSFEDRNNILKEKYGFEISYDDGNLYYNPDLRSFSGFVEYDEGDCVDLVIKTNKYGISPVGSNSKKVRNIIKDAENVYYEGE